MSTIPASSPPLQAAKPLALAPWRAVWAMIRFRPVLLTAITTILGLVPMALKLNWDFRSLRWQYNTDSSQWWQSMSLTVIFGMLVATVLTLGVVPTMYIKYAQFRAWRQSRQRRA